MSSSPLARAEPRLAELRLRVLVAADRNEADEDSGATSTVAWLANATGATRAQNRVSCGSRRR
jgi:hypothetical protein